MNSYHVPSYSEQARELAEAFGSWEDKSAGFRGLMNSYRAPLVKKRAAKRLKRMGYGVPHAKLTEVEQMIQEMERSRK